MKTIAGIVLCMNEVSQLKRCITSLSWCSEIYVVDSGSTDGSIELAKKLGAEVAMNKPEGRFLITEQRNWALDNLPITSEWVIFLDSDEEIKEKCKDWIVSAINEDNSHTGFEMTPRYWFLGKWLKRTQGYPNWHPRILRKGLNKFSGGVWESFENLKHIGQIQEPYEHYAFSKGIDDWLLRHMRYSSWDADSIVEYQKTKSKNSFNTNRKLKSRIIGAKYWHLKPIARFFEKYIFNGGWTEGWQGLIFSIMMSFYELITVIKIVEYRRKEKGMNL